MLPLLPGVRGRGLMAIVKGQPHSEVPTSLWSSGNADLQSKGGVLKLGCSRGSSNGGSHSPCRSSCINTQQDSSSSRSRGTRMPRVRYTCDDRSTSGGLMSRGSRYGTADVNSSCSSEPGGLRSGVAEAIGGFHTRASAPGAVTTLKAGQRVTADQLMISSSRMGACCGKQVDLGGWPGCSSSGVCATALPGVLPQLSPSNNCSVETLRGGPTAGVAPGMT
jgi:hypothetical protein